MEPREKKSCMYEGHVYSDDAEVCGSDECMICKDGEWEKTVDLFPPKKSAILSP